jgi:hypothetical protein
MLCNFSTPVVVGCPARDSSEAIEASILLQPEKTLWIKKFRHGTR